MHKLLFAIVITIFISTSANTQVQYYKGEWQQSNSTILFTCLVKLEFINDTLVNGQFIWTYLATDSSNTDQIELYTNKKGMKAIEYVSGTYSSATADVYLQGTSMEDKQEIISLSSYFLKMQKRKKILYGTTTAVDGADPGIQYLELIEKRGRSLFERELQSVK